MYAIGLTKGLVVGAAGGALVLAGFAGSGPGSSSAADPVVSAPQGAVEDGTAPDKTKPINIYKPVSGDILGAGEHVTVVKGGWLQAPKGELHVQDSLHHDESWAVTKLSISASSLKMTVKVSAKTLVMGTLTGTKINHRKTEYNGALSNADHSKTMHFKKYIVKSEFRGYDVPSGTLTAIGFDVPLSSGCIWRGSGHVKGAAAGGAIPVTANITAKGASIKPDKLTIDATLVKPLAKHLGVLSVPGKDHVYNGSGTTAGGADWKAKDLKLVKRMAVSACDAL